MEQWPTVNGDSTTTDIAQGRAGATPVLDLPAGVDGRIHRPAHPTVAGFLCITGIILISSTIAYLRLRDSFTFYMDDFMQFDVAHRTGLSMELLTLDVFQHFAPINRLGHLFMIEALNLDPITGALAAAVDAS